MRYVERSDEFETMLSRMNDVLAHEFPSVPVTKDNGTSAHIIGLPRSGTTILYQLLARTRVVGYPSNVMAFFWRAPVVGAMIQKRLAENEPTVGMSSLAGRTVEPLDPHEFGYFWREALGHSSNSLSQDAVAWTWGRLDSTLAAVAEVFATPVVYKNYLVLGHPVEIMTELTNQRYLVVHRDPIEVAASLLRLRRELGVATDGDLGLVTGDESGRDDVERVSSQVVQLSRLLWQPAVTEPEGSLSVSYDALCLDPRGTVTDILDWLGAATTGRRIDAVPASLPRRAGSESLDASELQSLRHELRGFL